MEEARSWDGEDSPPQGFISRSLCAAQPRREVYPCSTEGASHLGSWSLRNPACHGGRLQAEGEPGGPAQPLSLRLLRHRLRKVVLLVAPHSSAGGRVMVPARGREWSARAWNDACASGAQGGGHRPQGARLPSTGNRGFGTLGVVQGGSGGSWDEPAMCSLLLLLKWVAGRMAQVRVALLDSGGPPSGIRLLIVTFLSFTLQVFLRHFAL